MLKHTEHKSYHQLQSYTIRKNTIGVVHITLPVVCIQQSIVPVIVAER